MTDTNEARARDIAMAWLGPDARDVKPDEAMMLACAEQVKAALDEKDREYAARIEEAAMHATEHGCDSVKQVNALRAANACLVAGLEKADCTCDAEDSYYHSAGCYRCESLARARELLGGKS